MASLTLLRANKMKLLGLFLIVALASCNGSSSDINKWLDDVLERANIAVRNMGGTMLPIPNGKLNEEVTYSDGIVLGLDSFYRTADSTNTFNITHSFFDIHYGFRFLNAAFRKVNINGKDMSVSFRIRDNSINLKFNLVRVYGCRVNLVHLELERLSKVDFGSSSLEYDGSDVEEVFGTEVLSAFNAYLNSHRESIEKSLQILCHPRERNEYPEPPYLEFVEQFFYKRDL